MSYLQSSNFPLKLFACQDQYLSGVCFWGAANHLHCADTAQFRPNWAVASVPIKGTKHTIIPDIAPRCYDKHHCDLKITDCQRMEGAWRQPHPSPAFSWRGDRRGTVTSQLVTEPGPSLAFWFPGWFSWYTAQYCHNIGFWSSPSPNHIALHTSLNFRLDVPWW